MSYTKWEFKHTPFRGGIYVDSEEQVLENIYQPMVRVAIGDNKDSFSFKVKNFAGKYDAFFNTQDKIQISRVINSQSIQSTDILMIGTCKDIPVEVSGRKDMLKIEGYNYSELILGAVTFGDYENMTIPEALSESIAYASQINQNFTVSWSATNPTRTTTNKEFPLVGRKFFYSPLRKLFEDNSTNAATGDDVGYYNYVDKDSILYWKPRVQTVTTNFDSTVIPHKRIKFKKDTKDIKNFLIVKGGTDMEGVPVQTAYRAMDSIAKHGMKFYFLVSRNNWIGNSMQEDMLKSYGDEYNNVDEKYPREIVAGGTFVTSWTSKITTAVNYFLGVVNIVKGQYITINEGSTSANKRAYRAVLRENAKAVLSEEGKTYSEYTKFGTLALDIEVSAGKLGWGLGDVIRVYVPRMDSDKKIMRVNEIQYTTDIDTYTLREDIGTI